jgi:GNAT superfamily N-acetyltransferase
MERAFFSGSRRTEIQRVRFGKPAPVGIIPKRRAARPVLNRSEVLARYDEQMRRHPVAEAGGRVEEAGPVVRIVGKEGWILFAELSPENARTTVVDQVEFFQRSGTPFEWKTFGHDPDVHLETLLQEAGLVPDDRETIVVLDLDLALDERDLPPGVEVRPVADAAGAGDAAHVSLAAFGPEEVDLEARYIELLRDPTQQIFVAYVDGSPAASGRLGLPPGRSFAGLWGGGTDPSFRHRGVYRALVHARAVRAREAGYRYLTVDALETSRPILERLGFEAITTTRAWRWRPDSAVTVGVDPGSPVGRSRAPRH